MRRGVTITSLLFAGVAVAALAATFVRPVSDPDYWWHLRAGKDLLETRELPTTDPASLTAELDDDPGGPDELIWRYPPLSRIEYRRVILTGEWLSELALYGAYAAAGHRGTTTLALVCTIAALALALLFAFRAGVPAPLCLLVAGAAAWELWGWGVPRPQVFTYVAAPGFLWLFDGLRLGRRRSLVALFGVAVLWANLHAGYLVGLLIGLAFLAGEAGDRLLGRPARPGLVAAGLGASLAGFALNPNALNAIPASFVVKIALFSRAITEWQAPGADRWVFFAMLGVSAVAVLAAWSSRRAPMAHALLVLGLGAMGATAYRHVPLFVLVGLPVGLAAAWRMARVLSTGQPGLRRLARFVPVPGLGAVVLGAASTAVLALETRPHRFGVDEVAIPVALARHINELPVAGPVFNEYVFGGYLLWALDPPRQLFIDGRSLSERASWEYRRILRVDRPLYPYALERYGIDVVALALTSDASYVSGLVLELSRDPGWVNTFVGPNSAVFVRRAALPAPTRDLRHDLYFEAIRQVSAAPGDAVDRAVDLAVLNARLGIMDGARAYAGMALPPSHDLATPGSRLAWLMMEMGEAAERAGQPDEALAYYRRAAADPEVSARLALLMLRRAEEGGDDPGPAVEALETAVAAGTCEPAVHEALDRYRDPGAGAGIRDLVSSGLFLRALRAAEARVLEGTADAPSEFFRGVALLKLCRYDEAEQAFRNSAEFDGGLESAPPTTLANLGWALFDGGRPNDALEVFRTLLRRGADDTQALYGAGLAFKFLGRRQQSEEYFRRYLAVAPADDPWAEQVRKNLEELESFPHFRGI